MRQNRLAQGKNLPFYNLCYYTELIAKHTCKHTRAHTHTHTLHRNHPTNNVLFNWYLSSELLYVTLLFL